RRYLWCIGTVDCARPSPPSVPASLRAMRVLVTGGAGFIGSHLVDALVERGDDVVVLDDLTTGFAANIHPNATLVEASVADEDSARRAVEGCEIVFHQAAHKAVLRSV